MIEIVNVKNLTTALKGAIDFCRNNIDENIEIIVPDKLSLYMEQYIFDELNIESSFNIKVSTLNRFAKKRIDISYTEISKTGSMVLIHKILNDNIGNLKIIKSKKYSFGYADNIYRTISQLKASRILPDELLELDLKNESLKNKINDIGLIYSEYEKTKAGRLDTSDVFLMSASYIKNDLKDKQILFVGFDDFTSIEYSILERLAFNSDKLIIFNYSSKADNKQLYSTEVKDGLYKIAHINNLPLTERDFDIDCDEFKVFLKNNLFAYNDKKYCFSGTDNLKIFASNNVANELEFVARDIRAKILKGKKFKEIGVTVFDIEKYDGKIKEIFSKYDINYYIDTQFSLNKSGFFKFLLSLFNYYVEDYDLIHLINIINFDLCNIEKEEKVVFIDYLLKINYRGDLKYLKLDDEDLKIIKNKIVAFFDVFRIEKNTSLAEILSNIINANDKFDIANKLNSLANNSLDLAEQILIKKSYEKALEIIAQVIEFEPDSSLEKLIEIMTYTSSDIKINNLPLSIDCVKIVDASNMMEEFDRLYIVNANSSNAPILKHDCGIILDSEIDELNFKNKLSPTIKYINRLAKLRLYNLVTMFKKSITITYSGEASIVVKEFVAKLFIKFNNTKLRIVPLTNSMFFGSNEILSEWDKIENLCKKNKNDENLSKNSIFNNKITNICNKNQNIYKNMKKVSSTYLENYFKCPLYAYINNILKLHRRLDSEIKALDVGNILHAVVYEYYKAEKEVGNIEDFCKTKILNFVENDDRLKLNVDSHTIINLIDEAIRVLGGLDYIDKNSSFVPTYFEHEFKDEHMLKLTYEVYLTGKIDRVDLFNDMFRIIDYKSGRADASLKELYYGNKLQLFLYAKAIEEQTAKRSVGNFYLPLHNLYTRSNEKQNYTLKGFFENSEEVVLAMDNRLEPGTKSDIVNIKMTSSGLARKYSGYKELTRQEMNNLKDYALKVSAMAIGEINSGFVTPSPSEVSEPCNYCPYVHVCMNKSNNVKCRPAMKILPEHFCEVKNEKI